MTREFRLDGPPADSLLGFLSALGLLMTLTESRKEWNPRLAWNNMTCTLTVDSDAAYESDIASAAVDGIAEFGKNMKFPHSNLNIKLEEQSGLQEKMERVSVALGSDASGKKGKKEIAEPTPLCMMFGSGWQNFLDRVTLAVTVDDKGRAIDEIRTALFAKWTYSDTDSKFTFRWDPTEYRPHALRATDPTKEDISTVNGANRLAAVGFTACVCAPTRQGLSTALCDKGGMVWPLWDAPLSMAAVRVLITRPALKKMLSDDGDQEVLDEISSHGVSTVMKARLFWEGKFKNVSAAKPIDVV